jgi:uncharacterized protein (DUF1778 family)
MAKKIRDDQISIRISRTLRSALEDAASANEHGLSGLVRQVLIDYAAKRIIGGGAEANTGVAR